MSAQSSAVVEKWLTASRTKGLQSLVTCAVLLVTSVASAQVPKLIALQGRLTDPNNTPLEGVYPIKFEIFDAVGPGGGCLWQEEQQVGVQGGLFSVQLGSIGQGIPDSVFNADSRWLAISVDNEPEMVPRIRLTSDAYSYRVNSVEGASGGNIYGDLILHSGVTAAYFEAYLAVTVGRPILTFIADTLKVRHLVKATFGPDHTNTGLYAFIAGEHNTASGSWSTVPGGKNNTASGDNATVGGGLDNSASGGYSSVGGGWQDSASGDLSTIGGGNFNFASAHGSTVGGGLGNKARGQSSVVGGGGGLTAADSNSALGGWSTIGGGKRNIVTGGSATISGGEGNTASDGSATVGGGLNNTASGTASTVNGGYANTASSFDATVSGGAGNKASGLFATVGGGNSDTASGSGSTVPGGVLNTAFGAYSFAAGRRAKANHAATFVWADSTDADFTSTGDNQFLVRATGGVGINTTPDVLLNVKNLNDAGAIVRIGGIGGQLQIPIEKTIRFGDGDFVAIGEDGGVDNRMTITATNSVYVNAPYVGIGVPAPSSPLEMASGAVCSNVGVWTNASSRSYKTDIEPLKTSEYSDILEKVEQLDVVRFKYKSDPSREHIGFIAEDVPGEMASDDRKGVPTADAIAFMMAALKAQQSRIETLENSLRELKSKK